MSITLEDAQGAVRSLKEQPVVKVMDSVTDHALEGHLTKAAAMSAAAANQMRKGYFKKIDSRAFSNAKDFNALPTERHKKAKNIYKDNAAFGKVPGRKDFSREANFSSKINVPLDSSDYTLLARSALCQSNGRYFQASKDAGTRFLYVGSMPNMFVGRSIEADGASKVQAGLNWVVIVIQTKGQASSIVTMYPADDTYLGRLTLLTSRGRSA